MTMTVQTNNQTKRGRPKKMMKERLLSITYKKVTGKKPMKSESDKLKRATDDSIYDNDEVKYAVMQRAKEVQSKLAPEFPSMIKCMLPSHVTGGFWLGLPRQFCDEHMPKQDTMMFLEDESGVNSQAKYLTEKVGLSGGWRGFSIAHNLMQGDVLVFQLVMPKKFKVYIVRVNGSEVVDGALGLLTLEACRKEESPDQLENLGAAVEELEHKESVRLLICNEMTSGNNSGSMSDHSENENEDLGFDIFDGIRLCESAVDFKEVKSFEDFDILFNGLVINPELSKHLQFKYYELCCSKKSFLHEHVLEGLNLKLAAGVIAETINISDAIRASKLTTPEASFGTWKKTLEAFKKLGMNVDFLIERLDQLMNLAVKSRRDEQELIDRRRSAQEKMKTLEAELLIVKEEANRIDFDIQQLRVNEKNHELMFHEVARAPW